MVPSRGPAPGTRLRSMAQLLAAIRVLKSTYTYKSQPNRRFTRPPTTVPDPMESFDGKAVRGLHLDSEASVSTYDWYHSFSLVFEDGEGGGPEQDEIRGKGSLRFLGHQKVFYTASIEEFVITLAGGEGTPAPAEEEDCAAATVASADDNDDDAAAAATGGTNYVFNLRISMKPETALGNMTQNNFGGYYTEANARDLRRTYDVKFNAFTGSWPNSDGYIGYDYTFRAELSRSPYPSAARMGLSRLSEVVWEKTFYSKPAESRRRDKGDGRFR